MTLITDLTLRADASVDGTEEYVVNVAGVDYKVRGSGITKIVSDALAAYISSNDIVVTALGTDKADLNGDTFTGFVTLHADPIAALNAATKQYVDTEVGTKLDAIGGTLDATATGTTSADIDETTAVATNAYVANKIKYEILKKTLINAAVHNAVEADKGRLQVIYASNPVTINLPLISGLADRERVEYLIFDGRNDAENNPITINTNAADAFIDTSTSKVINTDGESIHIAASGANQWAVLDKDATATETAEGITRKATSAEAILLAETNAYITPATTKAILEDTVYKNNDIGAATKTFVSTDRGNWYVTYTSLGTVTLTLPDPSTLDSTVTYRVTDKGNATVNAITFNTLAGTINGVSGFTINKTGLGAEFFHDGTNWFTMNDVQTAVDTVTTANPLTTKTIDLGDWDMDATVALTVAHGLSVTEWKTVRKLSCIVRDDLDVNYDDIQRIENELTGLLCGGFSGFDSTNIYLKRYTTGKFDSTSYNSTSYNRGWLTFEYTPD